MILEVIFALYIVFVFINLGLVYAGNVSNPDDKFTLGEAAFLCALSFFSFGVFLGILASNVDEIDIKK